MAGNFPNAIEDMILNAVTGEAAFAAPEGILKVRLMTSAGTETDAGTEVTGGSYAAQTVTFASASSGATSNEGDLEFTDMPECTVVGIEIYDSQDDPGPVRWWYGPLAGGNKEIDAGDTFVIPAGDLDLSID